MMLNRHSIPRPSSSRSSSSTATAIDSHTTVSTDHGTLSTASSSPASLIGYSPPMPSPPPNMPLPPLPNTRIGKALPETPGSATAKREMPGSSLPTLTNSANKLNTPSPLSRLRVPATQSSSNLPSTANADETSPSTAADPTRPRGIRQSYRKTVSIGSFPQPPKGGFGNLSLSPSPDSTPRLPTTFESPSPSGSPVIASPETSESKEQDTNSKLKPRSPSSSGLPTPTSSKRTPSGSTAPRRLLAPPSPPESRPSSANGSAVTDGTQFEEDADIPKPPVLKKKRTSDAVSLRSLRSTKSAGTLKDGRGNVVVSVRVRPNFSEVGSEAVPSNWDVDGKRSAINYREGDGSEFRYDNVFTPTDNNERVYDSSAKRLVRRVMEGYHGTVFAYGITGTGKTFSMQGTADSPGIIPLAITDIFSYIREHPTREFLLRVSYLEIYNEKIYDLLSPSASGVAQEEIKLREDSKRGVYASPLKEEIVQSPTQLLRVIARGDLSRRTGSTQFNSRSSRSHAVVQIVVESRERAGRSSEKVNLPGGVLVSTLSLIDLAGSERAAEDKERRAEGSHINKSLLTLGTVISRLSGEKDGKSDEERKQHLPYRDSKLTRLLQSALSGNALISILCTVQLAHKGNHSAMTAPSETLNTLNFASRAKNNIISHAKRNESHPAHGGDARALLDRYRAEIEDLRKQLEDQNQKAEPVRTEEEEERWRERERESVERHEEQMLEMQLARTALKERIGHLNRLILSSKSVGVNSPSQIPGRSRDRRRPAADEVGVALGSPENRQSSFGSMEGFTASHDLIRPMTKRTVSLNSTNIRHYGSSNALRQMALAEEDEDDSALSAESGEASLSSQNQALQADLADKNRYIATLERRLLEARRSSHGRNGRRSTANTSKDLGLEDVLAEKDVEIERLRASLDDQTRMVNALRSATRRRDLVDLRSVSAGSIEPLRIDTSLTSRKMGHHQPSLSSGSERSRNVNFSRLTPVGILSPGREVERAPDSGKSLRSEKSLEEMTRLLDGMIQRKVSGGFEMGNVPVLVGEM